MRKPARILMYSQDSCGLGHLRRATNLANALVIERSDLSVLLVVDSPVAPFFDLEDHIDFLKSPTVVKVDAGVFRPGRLLASYAMVRALRSNVIREVLRRFRPDLILVDHMPGGANRDLIPALRLMRLLDYRTKVVLGLRDIIDQPQVTCTVWKQEGFYEVLKRYYDAVLIYGSADVFPTAEMYRIHDAAQDVRYCGYVCNGDPVTEARQLRAKLRVRSELLVTVMAGGGADAYRLMQTYLDALPLATRSVQLKTVMVTGPFMPEAQRKTLSEQAKKLGVEIHSAVGDSLSHLNAADLVVSMAGYNTLSEILRFQKPAVIVPRAGPSAEQRIRASIFAERGLVSVVDPADLSPTRMADAIVQALSTPRPPRNGGMPGLLGINRVTRALLDLLSPESRAVKTWQLRATLPTGPINSFPPPPKIAGSVIGGPLTRARGNPDRSPRQDPAPEGDLCNLPCLRRADP
jgi:predicted glycosyltransferase